MSPSIAIPKPATTASSSSSRRSNKPPRTPRTAASASSLSSSTGSPGSAPTSYSARELALLHALPAAPTRPAGHSPTTPPSLSTTAAAAAAAAAGSNAEEHAGSSAGAGRDKGKGKLVLTAELVAEAERQRWAASPFRRRPSLMGKELEATKHIVVDVGAPDAPRLISCVASSQGFDWNSSIFLPRYLTGRYADDQLEHRQDPIEDIFVSDEEAQSLLPQWS